MLKKLVKYGNSNALILDKAILELLNIEEGSIIKIKTDGKSIILTPHVQVASEKISETFTHDQAYLEATIKESFKRYKGIDKDKQEKLEKEYLDLIKRYQDISMRVCQNPDFSKKAMQIAKQFDTSSPECIEAYKALRRKYSPELAKIEQEIETFESNKKLLVNENNKSMQDISKKQLKEMEKEFAIHFKKYKDVSKKYAELFNNPEYQHKAQLIAEKYNFDKNSSGYIKTIDELTYKYHPEIRQSREALKAIAEKYLKNDTQ